MSNFSFQPQIDKIMLKIHRGVDLTPQDEALLKVLGAPKDLYLMAKAVKVRKTLLEPRPRQLTEWPLLNPLAERPDLKIFKLGNTKLSDRIAILAMPAGPKIWKGQNIGGTCGRLCPGCYAFRVEHEQKYMGDTIHDGRMRRYRDSLRSDFVARAIEELEKLFRKGKIDAVRVHDSGDFYSQAYVDKWVEIAKAIPDLPMYAYTKRIGQFDFSKLDGTKKGSPQNFTVIDSMKYGPVNYCEEEEAIAFAKRTGTKLCPCRADYYKGICGAACKYCQTKITQKKPPIFVKH